jgi:hypothetical protein
VALEDGHYYAYHENLGHQRREHHECFGSNYALLHLPSSFEIFRGSRDLDDQEKICCVQVKRGGDQGEA